MRTYDMTGPSQDDLRLSECPPPETLRQHLLGRLHGPAAESLDHHFSECERCLQVANGCISEDDFTRSIRSGDEAASDDESIIEELMNTIRPQSDMHKNTATTNTSLENSLADETPPLTVDATLIDSPQASVAAAFDLPFMLGALRTTQANRCWRHGSGVSG